MPNLDLKQLRETFDKSTQGEWRPDVRTALNGNYFCANSPWRVKCSQNEDSVKADADWMATAHNTYAQLLDIAEAAQKMERALKSSLIEHNAIHEVMLLDPRNSAMKPAKIIGELNAALAAYRKAVESRNA